MKGIIHVLISNILALVISVLTSFVLPKYLSYESYAVIKTYALYISYAGFFTLGYNDGMYLQYGGKTLGEVARAKLGRNIANYFLLEVLMMLLVAIIGIVAKNLLIIAFALGIFTNNILGYLKSLYQATGLFKDYGMALNLEKIFIFGCNMILVFIMKEDQPAKYIIIQIFVWAFVSFYLIYRLNRRSHFLKKMCFDIIAFKENIALGFSLMLANFSSIFFTGIDRWFVKFFMETREFSLYSFAVSMETVINTFLTPFTISLYNSFCINNNPDYVKQIKRYLICWGGIVIGALFPTQFVLYHYLDKYIDSQRVICLLFAAQFCHVIIKGIYVNIYKVERRQNKYLFQMILMIIIAIVLNGVFFYINQSMLSIALATFITSVIWLLLCEIEYSKFRYSIKEIFVIILIFAVFFSCSMLRSAIVGCVVYYASLAVILIIGLHRDVLSMARKIIKVIRQKMSIE